MTGCPANGLYMEMQNIANRGSDTLKLYGGLDRDPGICELKFDLGGSQSSSGESRALNSLLEVFPIGSACFLIRDLWPRLCCWIWRLFPVGKN